MIVEHPNLKFAVDAPWAWERCKVVKCDFCGKLADRAGHDEHEAVTAAQKVGFSTVRGATLSAPRKWACPNCKNKGTTR